MKKDVFNHKRLWFSWKGNLSSKYIEENLTKPNSKLYIQYLTDMESGMNIPKTARKGRRTPMTLNRLRSKIKQILKLLQERGINDISKAKEKDIVSFFNDWHETHSPDYSARFKAFWHWWMKVNRKEGNILADITEDISPHQLQKQKNDSKFVWLKKEEFDEFRSFFDEDSQMILSFTFDSLIRAPTELSSLKTEDIFQKKDEVWLDISNEISKTFGRKFNLVYYGDAMIDYIKRHNKQQGDYLFEYSSPSLNRRMQKAAFKMFGEKKSEGGEYYKNITLYDLRHSGSIHFRQLFQQTGQSLDLLRERGGWTDFKMIDYYTKRLGLDGHIQKDKLMIEEDKNELQKEVEILKNFKKQIQYVIPQILASLTPEQKKNILKVPDYNKQEELKTLNPLTKLQEIQTQ